MKSVKCSKCGLVNFANELACKKCKSPVTGSEMHRDDNQLAQKEHPLKMSRNQEIGFGIFFVAAGLFLFVGNFISVIYFSNFDTKIAFLSPVIFAMGSMVILVPYPNKENFGEANMPKSWAVFILAGVAIGILNWSYFMFSFF